MDCRTRRARTLSSALALFALWAALPQGQAAQGDAVRFAVIGDMGTGGRQQIETGRRLATVRERFPFSFVITVGDNIYGRQSPADFDKKFVLPYKALIDADIPFYASLGNHDEDVQLTYKLFNMNGKRYYTFVRGPVQFFALDSSRTLPAQLAWLEAALQQSKAPWKIVYQHHPLYSSGRRHGPTVGLQSNLEPLLMTFGVQVVFAGHEHFYERLKPQYGVQHFIVGSSGQLRRNGIRQGSGGTAAGFDLDNAFLVAEVEGDVLKFEAVSRTGTVVDSGTVSRVPAPTTAK